MYETIEHYNDQNLSMNKMYVVKVGWTSGSTFGRELEVYTMDCFKTNDLEVANIVARLLKEHYELDSDISHVYNKKSKEDLLNKQKKIENELIDISDKFLTCLFSNRKKEFTSIKWEGYFEELEYIRVEEIYPMSMLFNWNKND